jgi:PAS domain S-box-containing protein
MSKDSLQHQIEQVASSEASERQFEKLAQAISRSQHNYRELIDSLDQALFTISLQGEIKVANLRMAEILGASFQELIGRPLSDFMESPTMAEARAAMPALIAKGNWAGTLPVILKKDEEHRYFSCWLQAVTEHGQIVSVTGWARDITAQHEAEIRFAELFDSLGEGILFVTPEGRLLDANPALVRMLGYDTKEELQTINFRDLYDDPSARDAIHRDLAAKGSIHSREIVLRRKDGKKIHCLTSGFAIRDASGRAVRLQGTIVDITERLEIEKRLHREQEFSRRLVENFPDLIAVVDREGRFTYISDQVKGVLGRSPDEFIGGRWGARAGAEDQAKIDDLFKRVIRGNESRAQVEFRAPHADGSWRDLVLTARPLFDERGEISGVVTSARDVTEERQREQQLAQNEKFTAMGQMMAGAAHELNNPLTAILGISDLLRERATDENTRRQVDLILKQARRAAGIVLNLLAFSRPSAQGHLRLNLKSVVEEALQIENALLTQKNIRVKLEAPAELPSVEGDRRLLAQVFSNLIANAEQSISAARNGGSLDISISCEGGRTCVTFADDGPGIAPENIGKIFDPFFTTKRPGGGAGLGLTLSLAVVKEHGGTIEVVSGPGSGATFRVFFPVCADKLTVDAPSPSATPAPPSESNILEGHSVLVVDDEESIREILSEGLSKRGMNVHSVDSSEAALTYLSQNECEVILCDFNLPGISGDLLFEKLLAQRNGSPPRFVFMTGELVDPPTISRYREKGARILQKPFPITTLAALLTELLPSRTD